MQGLFKRLEKLEKRKKKRKKKRKSKDSSSSDAESSSLSDSSHTSVSSTDESDNDIDKIKKRKEKKAKKDSNLMVNSVFALAIKNAIKRDPARSKALETAFIARTDRPATTTMAMIYKDVSRIKWDYPALDCTFAGHVNSQIEIFKGKKAEKYKTRAKTLQKEFHELRDLIDQDKMLINAQAMFVILDSLANQHTDIIGVLDEYKRIRPSLLSIPDNLSVAIGRLTGFCIGYNFSLDGCKNTNCSYLHICPAHQAKKENHPFMKCSDNAKRWTPKELEPPKDTFKRRGPYRKSSSYKRDDRWDRNYDDNYRGFDRNDYKNDRDYRRGGNRRRYRGGRK